MISAWLILLAVIYSWQQASGIEFAWVYGLTVPSILVAFLLLFNLEIRTTKTSAAKSGDAKSVRGIGAHIQLFLLTVPLSFLASLSVTLLLLQLLPGAELNRLAVGIFVFPLIWALLSYWFSASQQIKQPLIVVGLTTLVSSICLTL